MNQYGLIGKTLAHSFSKSYFEEKFKQLGISDSYVNFECDSIEDVKELLKNDNSSGYNVTIPYKEAVIQLLDEISPEAKAIGAVNTIKRENGKLIAYNTDVSGVHQRIKPYFKSRHERALILGTGGASKAVKFVLNKLGCTEIYISRNPERENEFGYDDISIRDRIDILKYYD